MASLEEQCTTFFIRLLKMPALEADQAEPSSEAEGVTAVNEWHAIYWAAVHQGCSTLLISLQLGDAQMATLLEALNYRICRITTLTGNECSVI